MILVTGAAGKTGRAVIGALLKRENPVRALVRKESQVGHLEALGSVEVLTGDMRSQDRMHQVFEGVRAVYHIPPNVSPEEFHIGQVVIRAAQSAGVEHFVYHSVLHPQIESMPHHWSKMRVEERLFESGLPYTILQPAAYMQNILAYWDDIVNLNTYTVPYSGNTRLSSVDLEDVAESAAVVITDPGHKGVIYELCGSEILTPVEIAKILSQYLGRRVETKVISIEKWHTNARNVGMGDYQVETLSKMFRYYECFGFTGNSFVLECLLKRPATSFAAFMERTVIERS